MSITNPATIPQSATLVQTKKHAQREFEGQMLIVTSSDSRLHRLNNVGTFIWMMLETPTLFSTVIAAIGQNYADFDQNSDSDCVAQFLLLLSKKGLIRIS